MRTDDEVESVLDVIPVDGPSKWPGMTYEQGIDSALRWALGWTDENPMSDE